MPDKIESGDNTQKSDYWKNIKDTFEYIKIFSKAFVGIKPKKENTQLIFSLSENYIRNKINDKNDKKKDGIKNEFKHWMLTAFKGRFSTNLKATKAEDSNDLKRNLAITIAIQDSLRLKSNAYMKVEDVRADGKKRQKFDEDSDYRSEILQHYVAPGSNTILALYTEFCPRFRKFKWPQNDSYSFLYQNILQPDLITFLPNFIANTSILTLQLAFLTAGGFLNSFARGKKEGIGFKEISDNENVNFIANSVLYFFRVPAFFVAKACIVSGDICGKIRRFFDALSNVVSSSIAYTMDQALGTKNVGVIYPTASSSMKETVHCLLSFILPEFVSNRIVKSITFEKEKMSKTAMEVKDKTQAVQEKAPAVAAEVEEKMPKPAIEVEDKTQAIKEKAQAIAAEVEEEMSKPAIEVEDKTQAIKEKAPAIATEVEINKIEKKKKDVIDLIEGLKTFINNEYKESSNEVTEKIKILQKIVDESNNQLNTIKQNDLSPEDLEKKLKSLELILTPALTLSMDIGDKRFNTDNIKASIEKHAVEQPEFKALSEKIIALVDHMYKHAEQIKSPKETTHKIISADKAFKERIAAFEKIITANNPESEKPQPVEKKNATKITHFGFGNGDPNSDSLQQEPRARNTTTPTIKSEVLSEKRDTINLHDVKDLSHSSIKAGGP